MRLSTAVLVAALTAVPTAIFANVVINHYDSSPTAAKVPACTKPGYLSNHAYQLAANRVDDWIEQVLIPRGDVVVPKKAEAGDVIWEMEASSVTKPGKLAVVIKVGTGFSVFGMTAWTGKAHLYKVTLRRDCAAGAWHVTRFERVGK